MDQPASFPGPLSGVQFTLAPGPIPLATWKATQARVLGADPAGVSPRAVPGRVLGRGEAPNP